MKKIKIALTTIFVIICIIIFFIYTPFSKDKFYKAIPANTTLFVEQENIGSQINDIIQSYPINYLIEPYIAQQQVKTYMDNAKINWLVKKILSKKTAFGFSGHTGKTGEECVFAILQINSIQQIAKLMLTFYKDKNLVKSKTENNQSIWTTRIDKNRLSFTFSDGMLILTISKSKAPLEKILQQLSGTYDSSLVQKAIEQLIDIPNNSKGFYLPSYPHSNLSTVVLFSFEELSADQTHINLYPSGDILSFKALKETEIRNMLETINYYPTCFVASTPNFFTTICEQYINIPTNIAHVIHEINNAPTFISSASQKYSGKVMKLKTPSIMIGTQVSQQQKEQLIANIIKDFSTPHNQIYLTKEKNNNQINIFTIANDKNKYSQQSNTDKISFATKNQLTIFSTSYTPLNKIIFKPTHNIYKDVNIPKQAIAFAVLDIPKTISLVEEYLDVYAIYLIVSSDKQTNKKRSDIDNQIKPFLNKIKIPGTITTTVTSSITTPYKIEIKIK